MGMTDKEQKDLRSYCAFLLKEYGFDFSADNPVIPALYVIHKEMQLNSDNNKAIASEVKAAAAKINPTVFNFYSAGAAFKFQLGIGAKWILIGALVLGFTVAGIRHWSQVNKVEEVKIIISTSGNMGELIKRVRKDGDGFYYVDFRAAKGDSTRLFKYQKLDAKTVRVYVGKESE
jgi:hypothetical protein